MELLTELHLSRNEEQRVLALVLSGRFSICFGRWYIPEARWGGRWGSSSLTAVETMLCPALLCSVLEKMSVYKLQEEKWKHISKSVLVSEEMRRRHMD
jgi:hypothetical protein